MEFIFVLTVLGFASLATVFLLLIVAGVAAAFGVSFGTVFLNGLWALAIPPAVILYGWLIGRNQVAVNHVEIVSEHVPASFDGYRIVHISDMHLRSFKSRGNARCCGYSQGLGAASWLETSGFCSRMTRLIGVRKCWEKLTSA